MNLPRLAGGQQPFAISSSEKAVFSVIFDCRSGLAEDDGFWPGSQKRPIRVATCRRVSERRVVAEFPSIVALWCSA